MKDLLDGKVNFYFFCLLRQFLTASRIAVLDNKQQKPPIRWLLLLLFKNIKFLIDASTLYHHLGFVSLNLVHLHPNLVT